MQSEWTGTIGALTFCNIASPAPASEDALAGTDSGGEHPINSSPLRNQISKEVLMRDEPRVVASGKRPDNTHGYETNYLESFAQISERQGGVEGKPIEAPSLKFPADDRFADNVSRFVDIVERGRR